MSDEPGKAKIHVDSDWKAEAEAAKEQLAAEEEAQQDQQRGPLPEPNVADLINMIATPAAMALGGYKTPDGKTMPPDLNVAKFHIDLLALLDDKTKGNLAAEESRQLSAIVHQLRMQFAGVVNGLANTTTAAPPRES